MRLANVSGRLAIVADGRAVDVERASARRFGPDPHDAYDRWEEFTRWARSVDPADGTPVRDSDLRAPVPRPRQIFAVGINYRDHVEESGLALPDVPFVFTKFPGSITGPYDDIELPDGSVDFEVELVAVIGRTARRVRAEDGWNHIAGLTVGQDLSERELQLSGPAPQQFSLGKSYAGFTPIGPTVVTIDEFDDPDDIEIATVLSGTQMQRSRTRNLIFRIPDLVAYLSTILPLHPGDLVFTGTPGGIGWTRKPQRLITSGDELVTRAEGIGEMRHHFVSTTRYIDSPLPRSHHHV